MITANALVKMLSEYGVEVIFGVPGDTNVALYQGLKSVEGAPRHVMCRDERSAVFLTVMPVCPANLVSPNVPAALAPCTLCPALPRPTSHPSL